MNKFKFLMCIGLALITLPLSAQMKYSVSGLVSDSLNGEPIIGAIIRVQELRSTGTVSNLDGNYSIMLPEGRYIITAHVIGMKPRSRVVTLNSDCTQDFHMVDTTYINMKVVFSAATTIESTASIGSDTHHVDLGHMNVIRELLQGKDVNLTTQLLLRIKSARDGGAGTRYVVELQIGIRQHPMNLPYAVLLTYKDF